MPDQVVTFDFHNTIAIADPWFQVEVRDLPGAYLRWRHEQAGDTADPALVAEANATYRRLRQSIHHHGHELSAEQCIDLVLHQLGIDEAPETIEAGTEAIMLATFSDIAPVPGVIDLIQTLDAAGVRLGIVSSAVHHGFLLWTLDAFGIAGSFASVTTSASVGFYKSRPEIYWRALESLDASPERSLHLGDSYRFDVIGAGRAGMRTAWYQRADATPLAEGDPELTLQSFVDAGPLLLERLASTP